MNCTRKCVLSQFRRHAACNSSRITSRNTSFNSSVTNARRNASLMSVWYPRPLARALYACNTASSSMMVMRVLPVEGKTSRNGRNSASCAAVSSGLSSSGVPAKGAASTAAQSILGAGSEALSFKFLLLTIIRLSERNDMDMVFRRNAKHYHHQATEHGVVADETVLRVDFSRVFANHHRRVEHHSRRQQWQTTVTDIGFVLDGVAGEFHCANRMHNNAYCQAQKCVGCILCTNNNGAWNAPYDILLPENRE